MKRQEFIQALLDCKQLESVHPCEGTSKPFDIEQFLSNHNIRIKPEPREIWVHELNARHFEDRQREPGLILFREVL